MEFTVLSVFYFSLAVGMTPGGTWYFTDPIIAGEDKIGVTWALNNSGFPVGTDAPYKKVHVKLCYAPVSQVGRPERKTVDDLDKDKTCQFDIFAGQYNASSKWQYYESTLDRNVSAALYFVRAYVLDAAAVVVAYGQSTGPNKDYNIFEVQASNGSHETPSSGSHKTPSSGSHKTVDIVFICFNAFSFLFLVGFFVA